MHICPIDGRLQNWSFLDFGNQSRLLSSGGEGLGPECSTLYTTTRAGILALISVVIENECRQCVCSKVDGNCRLLTGEFVASAVVAECVFKDLTQSNPERHTTPTCTTAVGIY